MQLYLVNGLGYVLQCVDIPLCLHVQHSMFYCVRNISMWQVGYYLYPFDPALPPGCNPPPSTSSSVLPPTTQGLLSSDTQHTALVLQTINWQSCPTRAFSWLKAPTSAFTFKTLLRHYAKQTLTHSKYMWNRDADTKIIRVWIALCSLHRRTNFSKA